MNTQIDSTSSRPDAGRARVLPAWIALAVALAAGLAALAAGFGNRLGWWDYRMGLTILRWAGWGGVAGAVLSLAGGAWAWRKNSRAGIALALIGLVAGAVTFGLPWQISRRTAQLPPINDITTDTENPPRFVAVLPLRSQATVSTGYAGTETAQKQKKAYPDIAPAMLPVPPMAAFDRCLDTARRLGWEIVASVPGELRIEATDTTLFFGFRDDIVIRISLAGEGSRVDVRSLSRVGRNDFGTNAKRVRAFLQSLAVG